MIDITNINTAGGVVTVGGVIPFTQNPDHDGVYWGTVSGVEVGCTTGGINIKYAINKNDIFCDTTLPPVDTSIIGETCEVTFSMLETDASHLKLALSQGTFDSTANVESKISVGGKKIVAFTLMKIEVPDNDTGNITTWTFFKVYNETFTINFDRTKPTEVQVKFTAYADTSHAEGYQLFSIHEDDT